MSNPQEKSLLPQRPFFGVTQAAGVHDLAEALDVAAAGFDLLGIPLRLPVHRPDLSEEQAAALVAALPVQLTPVCITYETNPRTLLELLRFLQVKHVQLHASQELQQDLTLLRELRQRAPEVFIIKSCVVGAVADEQLERQVCELAPFVDAFISDTFDPASGASGATGLTHDWSLSRRLRELSTRPFILAGGLHGGNVAEAIRQVRPAGVDAHTSLEDDKGRKNPRRMRQFVQAAGQGFAEIFSGI